jgi:hypothetical protein
MGRALALAFVIALGAAALGAAALGAAARPAAAAPTCAADSGAVQVSVRAEPGRVSVRNGHGGRDLQRLQRKYGSARGAPGWHLLGLTVAEFRLDMRTTVTVRPFRGNWYCVRAATVDVTVGYPDFVVYVDRKYRPDTCEHRAVVDHEHAHIAIYRSILARFAPWVRDRLADAVRRLGPVVVASRAQAANLVQDRISEKITPILDKLHEATEAANDRIDTRDIYRTITGQCRNW